MRAALTVADRFARTAWPVLIIGATGVGKGEMARYIHRRSRSNQPYVEVTGGEFVDSLTSTQLFGHTKGSFTDAKEDVDGFIRRAAGGTLFLDEIQHWSPTLQSALLRPTSERTFRPVGAARELNMACRLVFAGTEHPDKLVADGKLLPDLRYRLPVRPITVPSLAERRAEILPLAEAFHQRFAGEIGLPPRPRWSPGAIRALLFSPWPGNIRQLIGHVQEGLIHWDGSNALEPNEFGLDGVTEEDYRELLAPIDLAAVVRWALNFTDGAKGEAAAILGVHRNTFGAWLSLPELQSSSDRDALSDPSLTVSAA
jgi:DNA-binding NtrC family response regulator